MRKTKQALRLQVQWERPNAGGGDESGWGPSQLYRLGVFTESKKEGSYQKRLRLPWTAPRWERVRLQAVMQRRRVSRTLGARSLDEDDVEGADEASSRRTRRKRDVLKDTLAGAQKAAKGAADSSDEEMLSGDEWLVANAKSNLIGGESEWELRGDARVEHEDV